MTFWASVTAAHISSLRHTQLERLVVVELETGLAVGGDGGPDGDEFGDGVAEDARGRRFEAGPCGEFIARRVRAAALDLAVDLQQRQGRFARILESRAHGVVVGERAGLL